MRTIRLRHILASAFGLMFLFVLWNNERFLIDPQSPRWVYFHPIRWLLLPHGTTGLIALGMGASQFSLRLRHQYTSLHRLFGKIYIGATFVLAPVAIWMAWTFSPWFLIPFTIFQATVLMVFTAIAYICIRRRDFKHHREWMIRSYSILLIFIEGRVFMAIPILSRGGMDSVVLVNWACIAVTLFAVEIYLRWQEIFPSRK
ncbi:MAG TPA: DUF2306 domain-containing protein [Terracidiphilus sp.]|nr:DUF2306 domain-containing protein [Terracidiphilus sp.]